jgi:hypothetical protein
MKLSALILAAAIPCAVVGHHGIEEREYFVRKEAFAVLEEWKIAVEKPALVEGRDARPPKTEEELRYWLQNMVWHHHFNHLEIAAAIGLERGDEIDKALGRFKIYRNTKPKRAADAPLLVLPYPGGRHPRIGFLDGAIKPQRETKVSIFAPWDDESYVVADIPEAIWSNLGLTYLAHTHVPTIWTKQQIELKPLEWNRREDGTFDMQRRLPNGIEFGTKITPTRDAVHMKMWLKNGTNEKLTGLRIQNCIMLKGARGFTAQNNDNKILRNPYVAVHDDDKKRWIITAWDPCHRPWANAKCPCLHSDPKFPDCDPGESQHLRGWLSFYEGADLDAELERIEATGWRK